MKAGKARRRQTGIAEKLEEPWRIDGVDRKLRTTAATARSISRSDGSPPFVSRRIAATDKTLGSRPPPGDRENGTPCCPATQGTLTGAGIPSSARNFANRMTMEPRDIFWSRIPPASPLHPRYRSRRRRGPSRGWPLPSPPPSPGSSSRCSRPSALPTSRRGCWLPMPPARYIELALVIADSALEFVMKMFTGEEVEELEAQVDARPRCRSCTARSPMLHCAAASVRRPAHARRGTCLT